MNLHLIYFNESKQLVTRAYGGSKFMKHPGRWWNFLSKKERRKMLAHPSHCILVVAVCMLCLVVSKLTKIKPLRILRSLVILGHF